MGNNYYCEYCDKRFKNDVNIRRKHMLGAQHQKAHKEHYAKYRSPKEILLEESQKKPCIWYQRGQCQYAEACHNSHYMPDQMDELHRMANEIELREQLQQHPKQYNHQMIEDFLQKRAKLRRAIQIEMNRKVWQYSSKWMKCLDTLPPSLQPIDPRMIPNESTQWG